VENCTTSFLIHLKFEYCASFYTSSHKGRRAGGGWGVGCSPPELGRNLLHAGNFPERTTGNSGNLFDFALLFLGRNATAP